VLVRDGVERSAVEARINAQMSDEEKIKLADYVIDNHNQSDLTNEVQKLIQLLSTKQH
jgi:dephospho-CoA kinase